MTTRVSNTEKRDQRFIAHCAGSRTSDGLAELQRDGSLLLKWKCTSQGGVAGDLSTASRQANRREPLGTVQRQLRHRQRNDDGDGKQAGEDRIVIGNAER